IGGRRALSPLRRGVRLRRRCAAVRQDSVTVFNRRMTPAAPPLNLIVVRWGAFAIPARQPHLLSDACGEGRRRSQALIAKRKPRLCGPGLREVYSPGGCEPKASQAKLTSHILAHFQ